jgi:hypothetical protein
MPTLDASLKTLALAVLVAAGGAVFAQSADQWYGGHSTGFWGLSESVGVRGALPGMFNPPGTNPDSLNAIRQFGGYRISNAFAIEGSQTQFGHNVSACNGDQGTSDPYHSCYGAAWSLSGVATLPFQSGLSLYGRLGLHYWQKGFQEEAGAHRNSDEPGSIGKVYGIGLSYGLTKSITVHAESERYSELIGNGTSGPSAGFGLDSSVHSIGLSIKF